MKIVGYHYYYKMEMFSTLMKFSVALLLVLSTFTCFTLGDVKVGDCAGDGTSCLPTGPLYNFLFRYTVHMN